MTDLPKRRRRAIQLVAVLAGGVVLGFLPMPAMTFATVSVGHVLSLPGMQDVGAAELQAQQAAADEPIGGDRVAGTDASTGTFSSIGVTFDTPPTEPVLIRIRDDKGSWGEWRELESEDDEGPDPGSAEAGSDRVGTAPVWVDDASGYEVSLGAADAANDAKVVLVKEQEQRVVSDTAPMADAQSLSNPFDLNWRRDWGARANQPVSYGKVAQHVVVHHSDSSNDYSPADVPSVIRSIQAYHMDGRGWADIAYNFVVDKYGGIWEGRAGSIFQPVIGAHSLGFNTNTAGVMVIGDYTATGPSAQALEAVSAVAGWKLGMGGVNPLGATPYESGGSLSIPAGQVVNLPSIVGHQDVGATACPGSIESYLGQIRSRSTSYFNYVLSTADNPVGSIDFISRGPDYFDSNGWAFDPNGPNALPVSFLIDNAYWLSTSASFYRPEWQLEFPRAGSNHGWSVRYSLPPGTHTICVHVGNVGAGQNTNLGCQIVK